MGPVGLNLPDSWRCFPREAGGFIIHIAKYAVRDPAGRFLWLRSEEIPIKVEKSSLDYRCRCLAVNLAEGVIFRHVACDAACMEI